MKKKLLFIFALLCMVAQGAWAETVDLSTITKSYVAQDGDVLTGTFNTNILTQLNPVKISIADGASITLRDATILGIDEFIDKDKGADVHFYEYAGITCLGDATITLEGTNRVRGFAKGYPGIHVPKNKTLVIQGDGSLYVDCNGDASAIGDGNCVSRSGNITIKSGTIEATGVGGPGIGVREEDNSCGIITIQGGNIRATGSNSAAGIGGDYLHSGGIIIIEGGTIEARGGEDGAGIGGGNGGHGGSITINGGTIKAYGGSEAAGIGGGEDGSGGDIRIYGGTIEAYGGEYAAGIGGGDGAWGGAIWITGGDITAVGGQDAAGIGGGESGDSGSIVINGGDVYAKGKGYGVGIGAGEDGDVDNTISINGGTVEAYGGLDIGRAIGGEDPEDYSPISIGDRMSITNVSGEELLPYHWRGYFLSSYIRLRFEPCKHAGATYSIVNAEKHQCICQWCGNFEENHSLNDNNHCVCGYELPIHVVHIFDIDNNGQYQETTTLTIQEGYNFILPLTANTISDYIFGGWVSGEPSTNESYILTGNETIYEPGSTQTMGQNNLYFKARYVNKTLDLATVQSNQKLYDGMTVTGTLGANVKISIADGATVTLDDITINGPGGFNYPWAGLTCEGNATIILQGTNTVKSFHANYPGIQAAHNTGSGTEYTLTIEGTGSLTASSITDGAGIGGGKDKCGNIHILSGTITAIGGKYGAGIGSGSPTTCGTITIEGGTITAIGGYCGAGIGSGCGDWSSQSANCGDITITSGVTSVTATRGELAPNSIGKGKDASCSTVTIGGKAGAIERSTYYYIPLENASSNTAKITAFNGNVCDVTLKDRTLYQNNSWNTLCLPFSMTAEQISSSPLAKGRIVELDTEKTTLSDGVLTIAYKTATAIEAGKPYMVKWVIDEEAEDTRIDNPIFKDITLSASAPTAVSAASITFSGAFAPLTLADGDKTKLWLDDDVRLRWASGQDEQVSSTWCYWNLGGLDASTLNAIVVTFDDGSRPIVELMDGMTDFSILSAFGEQEVNASLEGRELSAVQQADGTWQSRAYTLCLPFYAELLGSNADFTIYSKAEVTQDGELLFTEEMLPFLYPGNAYLIVVNEGTLRLQEEGVTIIAEADEADDDENAVPFNYVDKQTAGYWLGSLKTIGHDEAVSRKAFTLASDGSFQRITDEHPTWKWPAFRAMFCATDLITADKLTTKYQLDANGEEEEDRSLPAPESYQGDNDGEATAIAPVIRTIDRDGTERWFDLNGRQLSGKPTKKGVYIHRGKKQVVK